jgi:hypothetical protein
MVALKPTADKEGGALPSPAIWQSQFLPKHIIKVPAYYEMEKYIEMVCAGLCNFCVITSEGGLAKTWSTKQVLAQKGAAYAYLNSFTTPLELYNFLYDNARDKVILIDDCEGIWENRTVLSILKNATELNGPRGISWNSSSTRLGKRQRSTPFTSRIILLTNQVPNPERSEHVRAVLSRALLCQVELGYGEKLEIIQAVSKRPYPGLSGKTRTEICDFLKRNSSPATPGLSIRTLVKLYQFYLFDETTWKELGLRILKADPRREYVYSLLSSGRSVHEQVILYKERTGYSRADYYRIREQLRTESRAAKPQGTLHTSTPPLPDKASVEA